MTKPSSSQYSSFEAITAFVAKHEDVSGQRVGLQVLANLFGQAVEAATHIDALIAEPDAHGRREV